MSRSDDRGLSNSPNTTVSGDAQILESDASDDFDTDHIPVPAPHVGGDAPEARNQFNAFVLDSGGEAWASAKYPVDVEGAR